MAVARKLAVSKVFNVNLGGGEPLLLDDILSLIEVLSKSNIKVSLGTSGWIGLRIQAKDLKDAGLALVILSLDNADSRAHDKFRRCPGSYNDTLAAAQRYVSAGLPISLSTVLTKENASALEPLLELALKIGVSGVEFKRLRLIGNAVKLSKMLPSSEQERLIYEKMPKWKDYYPFRIGLTYGENPVDGIDQGCPCGRTSLCVLANGDITPCVYSARAIGNVLDDDIDKLWVDSPSLVSLRTCFHCQGMEEQDGRIQAV
jgi:MoaA/NifB/PqqE/SkfB family radical SAM enzyme